MLSTDNLPISHINRLAKLLSDPREERDLFHAHALVQADAWFVWQGDAADDVFVADVLEL